MWCHDDDAKSGTQRLKGGSNPIGTDHDSQCLDMVGEMPWWYWVFWLLEVLYLLYCWRLRMPVPYQPYRPWICFAHLAYVKKRWTKTAVNWSLLILQVACSVEFGGNLREFRQRSWILSFVGLVFIRYTLGTLTWNPLEPQNEGFGRWFSLSNTWFQVPCWFFG